MKINDYKVHPFEKGIHTYTSTETNFYTRCIIVLDFTVPVWDRELWEQGYTFHYDESADKFLETRLEPRNTTQFCS